MGACTYPSAGRKAYGPIIGRGHVRGRGRGRASMVGSGQGCAGSGISGEV